MIVPLRARARGRTPLRRTTHRRSAGLSRRCAGTGFGVEVARRVCDTVEGERPATQHLLRRHMKYVHATPKKLRVAIPEEPDRAMALERSADPANPGWILDRREICESATCNTDTRRCRLGRGGEPHPENGSIARVPERNVMSPAPGSPANSLGARASAASCISMSRLPECHTHLAQWQKPRQDSLATREFRRHRLGQRHAPPAATGPTQ